MVLTKNLTGEITSVQSLSPIQISEMYGLMRKYYDNVQEANFQRDLSEKKDIILLRNGSEEIKGFSTLMCLEKTINQEPVTALFSGDTIIDKEYWGESELPKWWGRYAFSLIDEMPDRNLYWFLMSKGYKTYKFLPVFFNEFYPKYDQEFPEKEKRILNTLASTKFPDTYNPDTGVVSFSGNRDHLREGVADIDERRMKDLHIRYFVEKNPGWMLGDELCCLMPLRKDNFNRMALRVMKD